MVIDLVVDNTFFCVSRKYEFVWSDRDWYPYTVQVCVVAVTGAESTGTSDTLSDLRVVVPPVSP